MNRIRNSISHLLKTILNQAVVYHYPRNTVFQVLYKIAPGDSMKRSWMSGRNRMTSLKQKEDEERKKCYQKQTSN